MDRMNVTKLARPAGIHDIFSGLLLGGGKGFERGREMGWEGEVDTLRFPQYTGAK